MSNEITHRYAAVGNAINRLSGRDLAKLTDRLSRNQTGSFRYEMMKSLLDLAEEVAKNRSAK